uniref:Xenoxin-2 n=1 Tax=Xenopus laevis TaxID=8355 RepID=XEN2_XENLA|nr:RecName: Full=Xenoxin-2 [Xenopus laevis]
LKCVNLQANGIKMTQECAKEDNKCLTLRSLKKTLKFCASDRICKTMKIMSLPGEKITCCEGNMCNA